MTCFLIKKKIIYFLNAAYDIEYAVSPAAAPRMNFITVGGFVGAFLSY